MTRLLRSPRNSGSGQINQKATTVGPRSPITPREPTATARSRFVGEMRLKYAAANQNVHGMAVAKP
ncbi:MAG: hypothetical protein MZU91_10985 [Desulfosudis oleivorans]|nr:hypothetical protein [Desulfosudis oleivorans]